MLTHRLGRIPAHPARARHRSRGTGRPGRLRLSRRAWLAALTIRGARVRNSSLHRRLRLREVVRLDGGDYEAFAPRVAGCTKKCQESLGGNRPSGCFA